MAYFLCRYVASIIILQNRLSSCLCDYNYLLYVVHIDVSLTHKSVYFVKKIQQSHHMLLHPSVSLIIDVSIFLFEYPFVLHYMSVTSNPLSAYSVLFVLLY